MNKDKLQKKIDKIDVAIFKLEIEKERLQNKMDTTEDTRHGWFGNDGIDYITMQLETA